MLGSLFIYFLIYLFVYLFICLFVCSFIFLFVYFNNSSCRKICHSAGISEILYKALGRFSYSESVTAACYMALSAILETPSISTVSVSAKGEGDADTEVEGEMEEEGEEMENNDGDYVENENNDFITCPLDDISPPSTSASLVPGTILPMTFSGSKNKDEDREIGFVLLSIRRKLSSLGLGTSLVDSIRLYPSSRQVCYIG